MDDNWTEIYSTSKPYQAEIAKQVLEDNGITSVVVNRQDSSYLFGEASVYVENANIEKAKELLKNIEN
ncbi:MAG: DUF2007 domain-containing protein [Bacteroidales bacterium]|nr:DUF2007 domain-containing protein [Bacteroidales bacterium]HPD95776.1 DUF2007 domain-containing protein [Tenuifilaceae bacterium]HRX31106.1 DUF2007 domain-containing protein [Tenuifilaceae bacterium]